VTRQQAAGDPPQRSAKSEHQSPRPTADSEYHHHHHHHSSSSSSSSSSSYCYYYYYYYYYYYDNGRPWGRRVGRGAASDE